MDYIAALEKAMGRTAEKILMPMQPGDVRKTWADTRDLEALVGYRPQTTIEEGVAAFIDWYQSEDWAAVARG